MSNRFTELVGIEHPIICGAMYPCSNPELVAAVSEAGAIGIVQPISLTYVHGYKFREGLEHIRSLTQKPIGLNMLIEKSSQAYLERNRQWLIQALDQGVRFFVTALGNPDWVVDLVHAKGGYVFHDTTERRWAERALRANVDGFICVNNRAGGHAGTRSPDELFDELKDLGKILICAGGVGDRDSYREALSKGYEGVQMGTRFIASTECKAHQDYKDAIVGAGASDIVLTKKMTGVPVSVINTPYIQSWGTEPGWLAQRLLRGSKTKHYMRMFYSLRSFFQLKRSLEKGKAYKDFFQAGKSVAGVSKVEPVRAIIASLTAEL